MPNAFGFIALRFTYQFGIKACYGRSVMAYIYVDGGNDYRKIIALYPFSYESRETI